MRYYLVESADAGSVPCSTTNIDDQLLLQLVIFSPSHVPTRVLEASKKSYTARKLAAQNSVRLSGHAND